LCRRVLWDAVKVHRRGQARTPNQLPVALADGGAEGFDVIDDFGSRRWFALGDRAPNIEAVEWLTPGGRGARQVGQCRIHIYDVNHLLDRNTRRGVTWPIGGRNDACAAFVEGTFAFEIRGVVGGDFDLRHICNRAGKHWVARATVVAHENDERIVAQLPFVERIDNASDLVVHRGDRSRVGTSGFVRDVFV